MTKFDLEYEYVGLTWTIKIATCKRIKDEQINNYRT